MAQRSIGGISVELDPLDSPELKLTDKIELSKRERVLPIYKTHMRLSLQIAYLVFQISVNYHTGEAAADIY